VTVGGRLAMLGQVSTFSNTRLQSVIHLAVAMVGAAVELALSVRSMGRIVSAVGRPRPQEIRLRHAT
jgi:vacuolar-type H+-ATPase subunit B/Vma2